MVKMLVCFNFAYETVTETVIEGSIDHECYDLLIKSTERAQWRTTIALV